MDGTNLVRIQHEKNKGVHLVPEATLKKTMMGGKRTRKKRGRKSRK
jgi:hypothetical protein